MLLQKNTPAYAGARFDANGHCLAHSDVRLCRLTNSGQYKIVRKTCYKCGSAALMTDPHTVKTNVHGYKKKALPSREIPSELLTASPNPTRKTRRSRTLSPKRRSRSKSVNNRAPNSKKPISSSHVMPRLSNDAIKGLMNNIKPPPFAKSNSRESSNSGSSNEDKLDRKMAGHHHNNHNQQHESNTTKKKGVGHCIVHPNVQLGICRTTKGDGKWEIVKDSCPLCSIAPSTNHSHNPNNNRPKGLSKSAGAAEQSNLNEAHLHDLITIITPPTTPTQPTNTPKHKKKVVLCSDEYFSRALVIYPNNNNQDNNNTCLVESVADDLVERRSDDHHHQRREPTTPPNKLHDQKQEQQDQNRKLMPNSTARMARRSSLRNSTKNTGKNKRGQSLNARRVKAYDAWESLPVH